MAVVHQQGSLWQWGWACCDREYRPGPLFMLSCSCGATEVITEPKGKFGDLIKDLPNYSEIIILVPGCLLLSVLRVQL